MGRKTPGRVRLDAPLRRPGPVGQLDGPARNRGQPPGWLSARGALALARFHRDRPTWLGVRTALRSWDQLLRDPAHRLVVPCRDCAYAGCCPDLARWRAYLMAPATCVGYWPTWTAGGEGQPPASASRRSRCARAGGR
jgi:hypothetical protein